MSAEGLTSADVDCIIVAHNAGALLVDSVASAVGEVGPAHVWVMDAQSSDDSVAAVRAAFPQVSVMPVENRGFSASNNRGIEATAGEWVLLLNPDAILEPGAVAAMVRAGDRDSKIAVVAPLVFSPKGEVQPESFGSFPSVPTRVATALDRLRRRLTGSGIPQPSDVADVDWVTGACMLVRRSAIDEVGAMDEAFFLYYEDVEWCHRMHDAGFRVVVEPTARCVHHLGQSDTPSSVVARAYRESFFRYCDLYGLWGLKAFSQVALGVRRIFGGAV